MKRICILLLALNLCIVLFACGGGNEPQNTDTQTGNGSETAEVINTGDRSNKDIAVQWLNDLFSDSNFHKLAEQYAYYEDTSVEERGTLEKVSSIDLSAGTEILLRYDGRFDVKLPISGDFIHKLRALEAVVEKRESYETGTMDLTRQDYDVVFSPG